MPRKSIDAVAKIKEAIDCYLRPSIYDNLKAMKGLSPSAKERIEKLDNDGYDEEIAATIVLEEIQDIINEAVDGNLKA